MTKTIKKYQPSPVKRLKIETITELQKIKLPKGWEIAKLTVEFRKPNPNVPIESSSVTYDGRNDCFYAKTPRGYIYPNEQNDVKECLEIMDKANSILKK